MLLDFSHVRFIDSDSNTLLNHWCEYYEARLSVTFWVKIPLINASAQKLIFMYFDNPAAVSVSDGASTFDFYIDVKHPGHWNNIGNGFISIDSTCFSGNQFFKKHVKCDPEGA